MVSDWSGAALEYAFGLERPVVFVDVPRKVNNPEYETLGIEPFEAAVRERIGRVVAPDAIAGLPAAVAELLRDPEAFRDAIRTERDRSIFNVGSSGRVAAEVIAAKADQYLRTTRDPARDRRRTEPCSTRCSRSAPERFEGPERANDRRAVPPDRRPQEARRVDASVVAGSSRCCSRTRRVRTRLRRRR